jgi:hypothetical protein
MVLMLVVELGLLALQLSWGWCWCMALHSIWNLNLSFGIELFVVELSFSSWFDGRSLVNSRNSFETTSRAGKSSWFFESTRRLARFELGFEE